MSPDTMITIAFALGSALAGAATTAIALVASLRTDVRWLVKEVDRMSAALDNLEATTAEHRVKLTTRYWPAADRQLQTAPAPPLR